MNTDKSVRLSLKLPLVGLALGWISFMVAIWANLYVPQYEYDNNGQLISEPQVEPGTYLFLLGLVLFSIFALFGQRVALKARAEQDSPFAKAAHRLNNLAVIVGLVGGAVFAISTFFGGFNNYASREASPLVRFLGVYLPIILATALVVTLILLAFVFRKDAPDLQSAERDEERARLQRYVGLAYASPILGTAFAIILGLVVYDITRTTLDVWIWVVIQAIIATSILTGTAFAAKVRLARPPAPRQRQTGLAAVNLNLVLAIVFGVVVTSMAFGFGASAVEELRTWAEWRPGQTKPEAPTIKLPDLAWFTSKMLPAMVLLALSEFGIYRSVVVRHTQKEQIA
jgi:hypothetical protein